MLLKPQHFWHSGRKQSRIEKPAFARLAKMINSSFYPAQVASPTSQEIVRGNQTFVTVPSVVLDKLESHDFMKDQ